MGSLSTALCNALLDHVLQNAAYTPPATVYLSLHTADPGETGASEAAYTDYARQSIAFGAAASRAIQQTAVPISFPKCGATGAVCTHWGLWTADTSGAFMAGGSLEAGGITIVEDNTPTVAASEVVVTIDATAGSAGMSTYLANKLLDRAFRNQAYAQPTIYLAATTTTCTDAALGTEATGGGYAREAAPDWDAASSGATANTYTITFDTPSGSWSSGSNIVATALVDGSGNMLFYDNGITDQPVGTGDTVSYAAGAFDVTLA